MKVIKCADVGFDCPGVIKAETEQQALEMAAQHAKEAHGLEEVSEVLLQATAPFNPKLYAFHQGLK